MLRALLAGLLVSSSLAASPSVAATMAVLPLRAEGLQLNEANRVNLLLRARAGTRGGYAVQGEELTTQLVEASQGLGVDCDLNAVSCGVEIGKIADVDFVLLGRAVKLADEKVIAVDVQLVDVKAGVGVRRIIGRLAVDSDQQTKDVDAAATALFGRDALPTLSLSVTPEGSTVKLDGIVLGVAPLPTTQGLLPGVHAVSVEKKTYLPWSNTFTLNAGEGAHLDVTLVVDPDAEKEVISDAQIAVPFVAAGVGGAVALVGAGLIVGGSQPWFALQESNAAIDEAIERQKKAPTDGFPDEVARFHEKSAQEEANWQTWGLPTTVAGSVAVGVGVAVVAAGLTWGVVLLTTDPEAEAEMSTATP